MRYVDFVPPTATAIVIAALAALAESAVSPFSLWAIYGAIAAVAAQALGVKYAVNIAEVVGARPSAVNIQFCACLFVTALVLAISLGG